MIKNDVIEANNERRMKAIIQLAYSIKDDAGKDACTVLLAVLDEYEAEIMRLEVENGGASDNVPF